MRNGFLTTVSSLASRRQPENQLSKNFEACFNESTAFRRAVLALLRKKFHIVGAHPSRTDYVCRTEVPTSNGRSAGRLDIELVPVRQDGRRSRRPSFRLENKLGARLTKRQLKKYVGGEGIYLGAVTKRHPEIPSHWLRENSICALRWQEVHRKLSKAKPGSARARFIIRSFLEYLEDSGMAHRDICLKEIRQASKVFWHVGGYKRSGVTGLSFGAVDRLLSILKEIRIVLVDELSPRTLTGWGPGYSRVADEVDVTHTLGFSLWRKPRPKKWQSVYLQCEVTFLESDPELIDWEIYVWDRKAKKTVGEEFCRKITHYTRGKNKTLAPEALANAVKSYVERNSLKFL